MHREVIRIGAQRRMGFPTVAVIQFDRVVQPVAVQIDQRPGRRPSRTSRRQRRIVDDERSVAPINQQPVDAVIQQPKVVETVRIDVADGGPLAERPVIDAGRPGDIDEPLRSLPEQPVAFVVVASRGAAGGPQVQIGAAVAVVIYCRPATPERLGQADAAVAVAVSPNPIKDRLSRIIGVHPESRGLRCDRRFAIRIGRRLGRFDRFGGQSRPAAPFGLDFRQIPGQRLLERRRRRQADDDSLPRRLQPPTVFRCDVFSHRRDRQPGFGFPEPSQ